VVLWWLLGFSAQQSEKARSLRTGIVRIASSLPATRLAQPDGWLLHGTVFLAPALGSAPVATGFADVQAPATSILSCVVTGPGGELNGVVLKDLLRHKMLCILASDARPAPSIPIRTQP
jgi:hypothetical protein